MTTQATQLKPIIPRPGDILGYVLLAIATLALGLIGWIAGGYFTLLALTAILGHWGVAVPAAGLGRWSIPLCISLIEIGIFRYRAQVPAWVLAVGWVITAIDFLSTVY